MTKVKKTYRLDSDLVSELEEYAQSHNISQTEALERAIQSAVQKGHDAVHDAVQENPEKSASEIEWKELYFAEKNRNDELSDRLLDLSGKVTDAFRAEKVTDAFDAGAKILESTEQKEERKSRWQRLKEAWREH